MQAIRGAIQIERNEREAIAAAVRTLCTELAARNRLRPEKIISAIFTLTPDLDADFPARAAREIGWGDVPLLCAQEIPVPGALPRVCRVLLHVRGKREVAHVYLGGAQKLRPDLAKVATPAPVASTPVEAASEVASDAASHAPAKARAHAKAPAARGAKRAKRAKSTK
jgi:chorismate mutase